MLLSRLLLLGLLLSLAACSAERRVVASTSATAPSAPEPTSEPKVEATTLELALEIPATVDGLELTWTSLQDSRCPADAVCVWAGEVTVGLRARDGGGEPVELALTLGPRPAGEVGTTTHHRVRLTAVVPYPRSTVEGDPVAPRATVSIERR